MSLLIAMLLGAGPVLVADAGEPVVTGRVAMTLVRPPLMEADVRWADDFATLAAATRFEGSALQVIPLPLMFAAEGGVSAEGAALLRDVAVRVIRSPASLYIDILVHGGGATGAVARFRSGVDRAAMLAETLIEAGVAPADIALRGSDQPPDEIHRGQVVRLYLRRKTSADTAGHVEYRTAPDAGP